MLRYIRNNSEKNLYIYFFGLVAIMAAKVQIVTLLPLQKINVMDYNLPSKVLAIR